MRFNNIFQVSRTYKEHISGISYSVAINNEDKLKYKNNPKDADGKIITSSTIRFENDYNGLRLDMDGNVVNVWTGDYRQGGSYTLDDVNNKNITIEEYVNNIKEVLSIFELCERNTELKNICISNMNDYWKNII